MTRDAAAYAAHVADHLPPGDAWPREAGSRLLDVAALIGGELARVERRVEDLMIEADPRATAEMLADWEAEAGLPDECSAGVVLVEARRAAVVGRLVERRSPTPAAMMALAAAYGADATITEHRPTTCEMACEAPCNGEEWAHAWTMHSPDRVIVEATCEDSCEVPLRVWSVFPHECAVRRAAPAHTVPLFGTYPTAWDFTTAALPAGVTMRRASGATLRDRRGLFAEVSDDIARPDYDAALAYNMAPNPWWDGVAAGVLPAGVTATLVGTGLTWTVIGAATEDGIPAFDIRLTGTPTVTNFVSVRVNGMTGAPALTGEQHTVAGFCKLQAGSTTGLALFRLCVTEIDAAGAVLTHEAGAGTAFTPTGAALSTQRTTRTRTLTNAAVAQLGTITEFRVTSGTPVDVTLRIGMQCWNRGATTLLDSVPLATLAARIGGVQQYGLRGLLVEGQRWSEGTNGRVEGAVAGTPGKLPHGWGTAGLAGVAVNVIGTGVEDGAPYCAIQIVGTPSANTTAHLYWPDARARAATPGEVISAGHHARLVAGTLTGIANVRPAIHQRDGTAWRTPTLPVLYGAAYTPTAAPLREQPQRAIEGAVLSDPAVARVTAGVAWTMTSGVAVNATLRIALPLIQPGARLSTPMMQDAGAPGAAPPAIEYVGGVVSLQGGGDPADTTIPLGAGLAGGLASGVAAGDLVVVWLTDHAQFGGSSDVISPGWTLGANAAPAAFWFAPRVRAFWKVMGATPDASVVVRGYPNHGVDKRSIHVRAYRNVDPEAPIEVSATATGTTADTIDPPSVTPTEEGAVIITAGAYGDDRLIGPAIDIPTAPGDLAHWVKAVHTVTNGTPHVIAAGDMTWTSGAANPVAWAIPVPSNPAWRSGTASASVTIALRRAGLRSGGIGKLRARDDLCLPVPAGTYAIEATGITVNPAGTTYAGGTGIADYANGLHFVWPAAAIAAGERHLQSITIRKVS